MIALINKKTDYLDRLAYWSILFLVLFVPFEDFILKFLPVSDKIYFYARFMSELLVYAASATIIIKRFLRERSLAKTPLDTPIFVLLQIMFISAIANNSGLFETLVNIRPVFRYTFLFYLVVNLKMTPLRASKILNYCIYAGVGQLIIGLVQWLSRGALDSLLAPRASELDVGGVGKDFVLLSGREIGSIYGAAGDTILFASFMILFLILILSKMYIANHKIAQSNRSNTEKISLKTKNIIFALLVAGTVFATAFTYARICIFVCLGAIIGYTCLKFYRRDRMAILLIVLSLLVPLTVFTVSVVPDLVQTEYAGNARREEQSVIQDTTGIFTKEYVENARQQRLGAVIDIPLTVIFNRPFFGFGPDQLQTIDSINKSKTDFLTRKWEKEAFNDVYWSATMAYYGVVGFLAMAWIFYRLQKWARIIYRRTRNKVLKELSLSVIAIAFITMILLFFNQFIEFRIYGLYFWLLPGLIFNLYYQEKFGSLQK